MTEKRKAAEDGHPQAATENGFNPDYNTCGAAPGRYLRQEVRHVRPL